MVIKAKRLKNLGIITGHAPPPIKVPDHLMPLHGLFGFFATRGSGKSCAMSTLLKRYKEHLGEGMRVFLICPTYKSNVHLYDDIVEKEDVFEEASQASLDKITEIIEEEAQLWNLWKDQTMLWKEYKRQERLYLAGKRKDIDDDVLYEAVELGLADREDPPEYKYGTCEHPVMFIVLDDCMSSALFNQTTKVKNNLSNLAIKHRHIFTIGCTIFVALQSFKSQTGVLSRSIRNNLTCQCIWGFRDESLLDSIHEELGREISKEAFYELFDFATKDSPHDFLCIEHGGHPRFRKNFDTVLTVSGSSKEVVKEISEEESTEDEKVEAGNDGATEEVGAKS